MKKGFTKYLSCIILVVICVICATVFYVHASDAFRSGESKENNEESTPDAPSEPPRAVISGGGTILSEYMYESALRCEWAVLKNEGENLIYLAAELYLDTPNTITSARNTAIPATRFAEKNLTFSIIKNLHRAFLVKCP